MRKTMFGWALVAALALIAAGLVQAEDEAGALGANDLRAVYVMGDMDGAALGSSRLHRNAGGVSVNLRTTGLALGHTYTLWWVVFNNPEFCGDACNADDLPANGGDPRIEASQLYADGHVVVDGGSAGFGAHLTVGDASSAEFGPGLLDPMGAEISPFGSSPFLDLGAMTCAMAPIFMR